jgi:hypothetical protein
MTYTREVWVEARGFPRYMVSSQGRVLDRLADTFMIHGITKGRLNVRLRDELGVIQVIEVHRLLAFSFFDVNNQDLEVNHIDGDRTNNALWNLEVITTEDNREHAYELGLMKRPIRVYNLDTGETYTSLNDAGRKLGLINPLTISKKIKESGEEFKRCGFRLKVIK